MKVKYDSIGRPIPHEVWERALRVETTYDGVSPREGQCHGYTNVCTSSFHSKLGPHRHRCSHNATAGQYCRIHLDQAR